MKILLDSTAYSEFMRGNQHAREIVRGAEQILLSAVVIGEQLYGFRQGPRYEQNLVELRSFLKRPLRVIRSRRTCDRRPLLSNNGIAKGEETTNSYE